MYSKASIKTNPLSRSRYQMEYSPKNIVGCAVLNNIIGLVSDPETGKVLDSFEFQTKVGSGVSLQFTVISDEQISVEQLKEAFLQASKKAPAQVVAESIGKGIFAAIKVPWRLTKVVVHSLEKVTYQYHEIILTIDWSWA